MIGILLIFYIILKYYIEMEGEELYKLMIILGIVNMFPSIIYVSYTFVFGGFDGVILALMTAI
jgi:hypothetical protein